MLNKWNVYNIFQLDAQADLNLSFKDLFLLEWYLQLYEKKKSIIHPTRSNQAEEHLVQPVCQE